MKRIAAVLVSLALAAAIAFWVLTIPATLDPQRAAAFDNGDAMRGRTMFFAGGCESCHAEKGARGEEVFKLGGGLPLVTPFGTFHAPNISPDPDNGIGKWTGAQFANAMLNGVGAQGEHLYPAFPFTSYTRMNDGDVADLWAFMKTLPPVAKANLAHELPFPFGVPVLARRGLGLWKLAFLSSDPVIGVSTDDAVDRGRYLVEGPAHCGECHTPRNLIGVVDKNSWLGGAKAPTGDGKIPNITAGKGGIGSWSAKDIAYYLESGFTPEFDAVGGEMAAVIRNMAQLPASDREAIAAYLKIVPAVDEN